MPSVNETAYPRIKSNLSAKELAEIYTPNTEEIEFAETQVRELIPKLALLILLKTFQRLGYFLMLNQIPHLIVVHISKSLGLLQVPDTLWAYDTSGSRSRAVVAIRSFLGITAYGQLANKCVVNTCLEIANTKDDLADIINVAIEELVRQRFELPAFSTLLRVARTARSTVNSNYYNQVYNSLTLESKEQLGSLLKRPLGQTRSLWDKVKTEPKSPTLYHMKDFINHLHWLKQQNLATNVFNLIPDTKIKQFAAEARSLDASSISRLTEKKRYTLIMALIRHQLAKALDDLAELFLKRIQKIHQKAKEAFVLYQSEHAERTDSLVSLLKDTITAYKTEGSLEERFEAIESVLGPDPDAIVELCLAHCVYAGNNYFPFLLQFYKSQRSALFDFLESVELLSTNQDKSIELAVTFLLKHKKERAELLQLVDSGAGYFELDWIGEKWWKLIFNTKITTNNVRKVNRKYFELCLFTQIMAELKSVDLCIPGSDSFSDYRSQLISLDEYQAEVVNYGQIVGLSVDSKEFINNIKTQLLSTANNTDKNFPDNEFLKIEKGKPVLSRLERKVEIEGTKQLHKLITDQFTPINILDALADTQYWLNWTEPFGPISGHDSKIENVEDRYVINTFCYGCDFGPTQTVRSIKGIDRKQLIFINQRHITVEKLDKAIVLTINKYNLFDLPKLWGSGSTASADGTKWDLYEQNLLSEYHIRYGGYGGIGYYHVSDTYIALFSQFTACGVWEGINILEGLLKNKSDMQPDTVHSDTHGQSATIFGLAYLLGIKLMPRIRNWKDLKLFKADKDNKYTHIDELFSSDTDWDFIETMLPDMLRVAMSIKAGRISSSTILRKLGSYSRKNKLYLAFRELGCVVRTIFLLQYISDIDLRRTIQVATNKSEAFNKFVQWVFFGGNAIIAENIREEQRKIIKYNHLVANLLILHNVVAMTTIINELAQEGILIPRQILATLSPYHTEHINRFGDYILSSNRNPLPSSFKIDFSES